MNKYIDHAHKNELIKHYQQYTGRNTRELPVCPRCERVGLRDVRNPNEIRKEYPETDIRRNPMTCPACGYHGYTTIALYEYLKQELYK